MGLKAAAPTDILLSAVSVRDNSLQNEFVGNFSAVGSDAGEVHTYTLIEGAGSADNFRFRIAENQLLVKDGFGIDVEPDEAGMTIRVRVKDAASHTFQRSFSLAFIDDRTEDADGDGLTEEEEEDVHGTSDSLFDNDGDGVGDGAEITAGTSPTDPGVWPTEVILGWGNFSENELSVPPGGAFVGLDSGQNHNLSVAPGGAVQAWGGKGSYGQTIVPGGLGPGNAVSAGGTSGWRTPDTACS